MMTRRTIVIEGTLAFRKRRIEAARSCEAGVQIMTLPQLAGRRGRRTSDSAICKALEAGGFADLENIRGFPGMTRSVSWTLTRVWNADVRLAERDKDSARLEDSP
jgi:hypothetical protein